MATKKKSGAPKKRSTSKPAGSSADSNANSKRKSARAPSAIDKWAAEVRETLLGKGKVQAPGLGTFSTCARKAAPGRAACRIAMFRADPALRADLDAGSLGSGRAPRDPVAAVCHALGKAGEIAVPGVGRLTVDGEGKKLRVLFRGDETLNNALSA